MNQYPPGTGSRSFDLVIFDCDGVLVDSEPIMNDAYPEVLEKCGYRTTPAEFMQRFCGMSDAETFRVIEAELGRPLPADFEAQVAALVDARCEASLTTPPGVHDALAVLHLPVCVASSGLPRRIRTSLRIVGLLERFEPNIFSAAMVARGKPAPDLFLHAASEMGVDPACCLVVEDSVAGVRAAVTAGMTVIGFCGGSHCQPAHADVLRNHGASACIKDMRDLIPILD